MFGQIVQLFEIVFDAGFGDEGWSHALAVIKGGVR